MHHLDSGGLTCTLLLLRRPTLAAQSSFEKSLWNKTSRTNARQEGMQSYTMQARLVRRELRGMLC